MPTIPNPSPFDRSPKPEYRQAVEKPACIPPEIAGNGSNSRNFALNPDWRKCPAELCEPALPPFSREGPLAVRPQRPPSGECNAKTDDPRRPWFLSSFQHALSGPSPVHAQGLSWHSFKSRELSEQSEQTE